MKAFLSMPLRTQYPVKHPSLHAILSPNTKDILHPDSSHIDSKVTKDKSSHDSYSHEDIPFNRMRSHINSMLYGPHRSKAYSNLKQAQRRIQRSLEEISTPRTQQPAKYLFG
jgi:delta-aminolevulinic acid dehydratase/porphobilinogen synthase